MDEGRSFLPDDPHGSRRVIKTEVAATVSRPEMNVPWAPGAAGPGSQASTRASAFLIAATRRRGVSALAGSDPLRGVRVA